MSKPLGEVAKYKELSDEDRAPYEAKRDEAKKIYEEAMVEYKNSGRYAYWERDPEKPKKPLNGYMNYLMEFKAKLTDTTLTNIEKTKQGAVEWNSLGKEDKAR